MAYRFKLKEPGPSGARRILLEQIAVARDELHQPSDPVTAIHEARKALKRARALLRLIAPVGDQAAIRSIDRALRDVGRTLSAQRDRDVMRETLSCLAADKSFKPHLKTCHLLREQLGNPTATANGKADPEKLKSEGLAKSEHLDSLLQEARSKLKKAASAAGKLSLPPAGVAETLLPGLKKTYREGRRQRRRAIASTQDEDWHDWRKATQAHWRQMMLVKAPWPAWFETRVEVARCLSQILGTDHDLSVLKDFVSRQPKDVIPVRDQKRFVAAIEDRQWAARREARNLADRLYAQPAKSLMKEIATYWRVATKSSSAKAAAEKNSKRLLTSGGADDQPHLAPVA